MYDVSRLQGIHRRLAPVTRYTVGPVSGNLSFEGVGHEVGGGRLVLKNSGKLATKTI